MKRILLSMMAVLAMNTAYGQVKATSAELNAGIDDTKFATALALQGSKYLDQSGAKLYAVTAAGANTYTAAIVPAITAYNAGQVFFIKITTANTGSSTLNLNGLGAKMLVKDVSTALVSDDLLANKIYAVYYDGTNFQVMNAADALKANLASPAFTGVPTAPTAVAGTNTTQLATTAFVNAAIGSSGAGTSQTLSLNTGAGEISISGSGGNTVGLLTLGRNTTAYIDANTVPASAGFFPFSNTNVSVLNYPLSSAGGGFKSYRIAGNTAGSFELWKESSSTDALYFRTGIGGSTFNAWDVVAGRAWVANNHYTRSQSNLIFFGNGSANGGLIVAETLDVDALPAKTFATYANTTSTNLPENTGTYGGLLLHSSQSAGVNYFQQYMGRQGNDAFYYRNFASGTATSPTWNRVASREWASNNFIGNGTTLGSTLKTESGLDVNTVIKSNIAYVTAASNIPTIFTSGVLTTNLTATGVTGSQTYLYPGGEDFFFYRKKVGNNWGSWFQMASREWVSTQIQSISSMATNKLLGRYAAGSGVAQDITLGSGLMLTSTGVLHSGYETGASGAKIIKVSNPAGGQFKSLTPVTGAIKIKLPSNAAVMYTIKGTLFQYDGTSTTNRSTGFLITCYGYAMANGFSATFTGNNAPNYPVRWYTDGTTPAIYIGELTSTWSYVKVTIDEVQASHSGATIDLAADGWAVTLETAFTGTLAATQLNTLPFSNLSQPLAGFTAGADNALSQTDTQIAAFGKIQGQLNAIKTVTGTAAAANVVYAGPITGTANPVMRKLQRSDLTNAFGANSTSGTLDWNDITNTQPGFGPTLITGTSTNGPGGSAFYHPFTVEYSSKTGNGNMTQIGYPYNPGAADGITWRWRYNTTWSAWRKVWDSSNFTNLNQLTTRNFSDLQAKPTTLTGYGITDGATSASVTAVQASVTSLDGNAVHKAGIETITGTKFFNGGMGIGLAVATVPSAYKLAVGGGIIAESVKVKPQGEWPDYVFKKGYQMLSLGDLEKFILKNKHLPDVPAAAEVKKEGLDLGEMDSKLLKKIEELTLYLIDLKKENETLKERLDKLEKK